MAMIKKEVTGDANALKLVADARQAPVAAGRYTTYFFYWL